MPKKTDEVEKKDLIEFNFPEYGVTIAAFDIQEAQAKLQKSLNVKDHD